MLLAFLHLMTDIKWQFLIYWNIWIEICNKMWDFVTQWLDVYLPASITLTSFRWVWQIITVLICLMAVHLDVWKGSRHDYCWADIVVLLRIGTGHLIVWKINLFASNLSGCLHNLRSMPRRSCDKRRLRAHSKWLKVIILTAFEFHKILLICLHL